MKFIPIYFFCFLFISCIRLHAQNVEGVYESIIPDRVKEVLTVSAGNKYEELEYRMYKGEWKLKCTYKGSWSVSGDTLITKYNEVDWASGDVTKCNPVDDTSQPGCCLSIKYFFDEKSLWVFGDISGDKYIYTKKK